MANIRVGRLNNTVVVNVPDNTTINAALQAGNFVRVGNEVIQDLENVEYDGSELIEPGHEYLLVQRVKSGY